MATFIQRLSKAFVTQRSLLCVGLDPNLDEMPIRDVAQFNKEIIGATFDLVCAYKPNLAFYEALGIPGLQALRATIDYIRGISDNVMVIGDGKRGDIGNTSRAYAKAFFEEWGFDAVTVNAYGGGDSIQPFIEYEDRGVFVWCRSSNPGSGEFQDLEVMEQNCGLPLFHKMASQASNWNHNGNVGLVVGATYPNDLGAVRGICPSMPLLIPGVGAQLADLKETVVNGIDQFGRMAIINASRSIIYASAEPDYAASARKQALNIRDSINRILEESGFGWD